DDIVEQPEDALRRQPCPLAGLYEMPAEDPFQSIMAAFAHGHGEFHLLALDAARGEARLRGQHVVERRQATGAARSDEHAEILGVAVCRTNQPEHDLRLEE